MLRLSALTLVSAQLFIKSPKELANSFNRTGTPGIIGSKPAAFGFMPYGYDDRISGLLLYPEMKGNTQHGCLEKNYDHLDEFKQELAEKAGKMREDEQTKHVSLIFLIKRGECNFVRKIKTAQDLGAEAVIVYNNQPSSYWNGGIFTMGDDSYGRSINIASVMISMEDGEKLVEAARKNKQEHIDTVVEIEWLMPANDIALVDIWMSSYDFRVYEFLKELQPYAQQLAHRFQLLPHYDVYRSSQSWNDECLNNNQAHCSVDPSPTGLIRGKHVVEEDLRQLCIWEVHSVRQNGEHGTSYQDLLTHSGVDNGLTKETAQYASHYWDYVSNLLDRCPLAEPDDDKRFGTVCAEKVMREFGIDVNAVHDCMKNQGDRLLDLQVQNNAYMNEGKYLRINNVMYQGFLDAENVFHAICSGLKDKPDACTAKKSKFSLYDILKIIGICFVILVCASGIIFWYVNKYTRQAVKDEVLMEVSHQMAEYAVMYEEYDEETGGYTFSGPSEVGKRKGRPSFKDFLKNFGKSKKAKLSDQPVNFTPHDITPDEI